VCFCCIILLKCCCDGCDERLVKAVEDVVEQLLQTHNSVWLSSQNVAVRAHKVESHGFVGISCTAYADESESFKSRHSDDFTCTDLKADETTDKDDSDVHTEDRVSSLISNFVYLFKFL